MLVGVLVFREQMLIMIFAVSILRAHREGRYGISYLPAGNNKTV
jgi:hypothetical protein